jgi:replicative DNA helicase
MQHVNGPDLNSEQIKNISPIVDVYVEALKNAAMPPTGIRVANMPQFDNMLGGFRPREYTIFCAPTGAGKTQWLSCLSANFLKSGHKHFVMSVETGHTDYVQRIMSAMDGFCYNSGDPVPVEKLEAFDARFGSYFRGNLAWLGLYENRVPVEELISILTKMQSAGYPLAIIDNLNFFMEPQNQRDSIIEMDRVVHELIMLCKRIDIHIIMVQHPRKTESGRVTNEFDIKGSSTAVQEAHNILVLNRPDPDDVEDGERLYTDRELLFIKLRRRGQYAGKSMWFKFNNYRYEEYAE